jgi:SagB-type dehydrogenase family enzyme
MTMLDASAMWKYHNLTKHSCASIRADRHYLDWSNQPSPFKVYRSIDPIPLPVDFASTAKSAFEAIAHRGIAASREVTPTIEQIASILVYSAGVMKEKKYPGGSFYFRAAACAGALYPTEVYLVCGDLDGLPAGVYHFDPGDFALRRLREGDFGGVLARATADEPRVNNAPVTMVFTAISWRSTWKYRDRAYRYHFWDNGMILANALAMAAEHELPAEVVMGFVEAEVNKLIGIDGQQELALSLLPLGHAEGAPPDCPSIESLPEINFEVLPIWRVPVDYPSIREMHLASSFGDRSEVSGWRAATVNLSPPAVEGEEFTLAAMPENSLPQEAIEAVIERRASTRRFARKPMPLTDLSAIIDRATRGIPTDFSPGGSQLNDIYAIVNRVEGLPSGVYFYRREDRALELLKPGDFSEKAAYLTLEQDLGGDAGVTFFFMADLNRVVNSYGNRGYRAAQMEAGIIGGKMYLASYALKRGATGLTFYDDEVTEFFSPHAAGKSCMLVVSVGIPGKKPLA